MLKVSEKQGIKKSNKKYPEVIKILFIFLIFADRSIPKTKPLVKKSRE